MINIAHMRLRDIVTDIFVAASVPVESARIVADSLVESNLVGHDSHGVLRVGSYVQMVDEGRMDPSGEILTVRESASTALLDGGNGFGQIISHRAMALALAKARDHDQGLVAVRHCGHTGRMGEFVAQAAQEGYVAMVLGAGSKPGGTTAPYLGTSPVFNTNPIAWGVPANTYPAVFIDYATSACAYGKIAAALDKGTAIPEGWILDAEGNPSTDPHDYRRGGVLLPFGGHKGYGLAFLVEALCGGLTGSSCAPLPDYTADWSLVMHVVRIGAFQPLEGFKKRVDGLIEAAKAARKAPGVTEILVPGEMEWKTRAQRVQTGLDLPDATWERIVESGAKHGLTVVP